MTMTIARLAEPMAKRPSVVGRETADGIRPVPNQPHDRLGIGDRARRLPGGGGAQPSYATTGRR
jgi:hypothetical protein